MRVIATRLGDVLEGDTVKAVFPDQVYDISEEAALPGLTDGWLKRAEAPEPVQEAAGEPSEDKAEGKVEAADKAVRGPRRRA